jgi:hypothetical protein
MEVIGIVGLTMTLVGSIGIITHIMFMSKGRQIYTSDGKPTGRYVK